MPQKPVEFVAYYRVSTERQGRSGLGLEARQAAVHRHLATFGGSLIGEHTEVETGKRSNRPQLRAALAACRRHRAKLVIAKLDRLSRNVAFIAAMMDSGVEFVACDNPHATRLTLHILAAVAEHERDAIATRTKAALQAAKVRGIRLGRYGADYLAQANKAAALERASRLKPIITQLIAARMSIRKIAAELTARGIPGGGSWHPQTVARLIRRTVTHIAGQQASSCSSPRPWRFTSALASAATISDLAGSGEHA